MFYEESKFYRFRDLGLSGESWAVLHWSTG